MGISKTSTVKFIRKGEKGNSGPMMRGPQYFDNIANGYQFYSGTDNEDIKDIVIYNGNYYTCTKSHVKSVTDVTTNSDGTKMLNATYWHLGQKIDLVATYLLLAQYALIKNLGVETIDMRDANGNVLFQAKDGNVLCKTGTFENVTVTGHLKGVSGTFYKLSALDNNGKESASIYFSSEGRLTFEGDIYNQGVHPKRNSTFRFYSGDIWGRGSFGTRCRNVLVVEGNRATFFSQNWNKAGYAVTLTGKMYGETSYYQVPCYGESGDYAGFPVDTIIFKNTSSINYELLANPTQRLMIVNGNDKIAICVFSNGNLITWRGGEIAEVVQLPNNSAFINPVVNTSYPGAGLLVGAFRDNNWA